MTGRIIVYKLLPIVDNLFIGMLGKFFRIVLCLFLLFPFILLFPGMGKGIEVIEQVIKKSVIAGSWYPGNPERLRKDIEEYIDNVPAEAWDEKIIGIVSPHAGYMYSGQVAAHAYKLLMGRNFDTVVVIGPSHRAFFRGVSIYDRGGYETPLGIVPVDMETAEKIQSQSRIISFVPDAHRQEHSVEIQLPFLQVTLKKFSFVPVVMGTQDEKTCRELAGAIAEAVKGKNVLIVGSSDLSHFRGYEKTVKMDSIVLDHMKKMDFVGLLRDLERGVCEACGGGPIAVTMMVSERLGANEAKVLKYANSGDVTGDKGNVVGYTAAAFYKTDSGKHSEKKDLDKGDSGFSEADKDALLEIARKSIESEFTGLKAPMPAAMSNTLKKKMGAFVTIKKHGQLRGCIGYIEAVRPLYATVREMARAAAFDDPRFPPLSKKEMKDLTIEVSALTPLKEIKDTEDIIVGRHGIYIVKGFHSGLLLPQVAVEQNWDRTTFLEQTCRKAGLSVTAWKDKGARIYIFSADIIREEK
ncbi:MAG: AmmeMemoRadiSam system protein B [Deltaproteobacteria bacterium]|nr:AmmeMemoRadiSam system protein B [Deltaproteobacteria bacterium]